MDAEARQKDPMRLPIGINLTQVQNSASNYQTNQSSNVQNLSPSSSNTTATSLFNPPSQSQTPYYQNTQGPRQNNRGRTNYQPRCQLYRTVGHFVDRCIHRFDRTFVPPTSNSYRPPDSQYYSQPTTCYPTQPQLIPQMPAHVIPQMQAQSYQPSSLPPQTHIQYVPAPTNPRPTVHISEYSPHQQAPRPEAYNPYISEPPQFFNPIFPDQNSQLHSSLPTVNTTPPKVINPTENQSPSTNTTLDNKSTTQVNTAWFADTGASRHVTPNLGNLHLHDTYTGTGNVVVGNGSSLYSQYWFCKYLKLSSLTQVNSSFACTSHNKKFDLCVAIRER